MKTNLEYSCAGLQRNVEKIAPDRVMVSIRAVGARIAFWVPRDLACVQASWAGSEVFDVHEEGSGAQSEFKPLLPMGEAVLIYWPHSWRTPVWHPNFERMGLIY